MGNNCSIFSRQFMNGETFLKTHWQIDHNHVKIILFSYAIALVLYIYRSCVQSISSIRVSLDKNLESAQKYSKIFWGLLTAFSLGSGTKNSKSVTGTGDNLRNFKVKTSAPITPEALGSILGLDFECAGFLRVLQFPQVLHYKWYCKNKEKLFFFFHSFIIWQHQQVR